MTRLTRLAKAALDGLATFGLPDPKAKRAGAGFRILGAELNATTEGVAVRGIGLEIVGRDTDPDALVALADRMLAALGGRFAPTEVSIGGRGQGGVYFELRLTGTFR